MNSYKYDNYKVGDLIKFLPDRYISRLVYYCKIVSIFSNGEYLDEINVITGHGNENTIATFNLLLLAESKSTFDIFDDIIIHINSKKLKLETDDTHSMTPINIKLYEVEYNKIVNKMNTFMDFIKKNQNKTILRENKINELFND